jgi:hypothetical protein
VGCGETACDGHSRNLQKWQSKLTKGSAVSHLCGNGQTAPLTSVTMHYAIPHAETVMPTPPNLGICAVRYLNQYIDTVHVIYADEIVTGEPLKVSRQTVVDAIRNGAKIETLHKTRDTWDRWGGIKLITVDGTEFIKLVDDKNPEDDLGDLPEY